MPLYEYDIPEAATTVQILRPVKRRNAPVKVRRRTVPSCVTTKRQVPDPAAPATQVLNGYKRLEEKGKLKTRFTADQVKQAWATPAVPDPGPVCPEPQ